MAEAAGISKPMVYAYLGTKEDLFTACLHREGVRLIEALAAAAGTGGSPREQLHSGLAAFLRFVADHRDGWTVLYRQARGPFADVLLPLRTQMVDMVSGMLGRAGIYAPTLGYAIVGAAEALADWVVDNPDENPELAAARLAEVLWCGAGTLVT